MVWDENKECLLSAKVENTEYMSRKWLSEGDIITRRLKRYHMLLDGSQNLLGLMDSSFHPQACFSGVDRNRQTETDSNETEK